MAPSTWRLAIWLVAVFLVACCCRLASSSSVCESAYQRLSSLPGMSNQTARNSIYTSLSSDSNNVCGLESTCCSSSAETHFKNDAGQAYQSRLFNILQSAISPCTDSTLTSVTIQYIQSSKSLLLQGLNAVAPTVSSRHRNLFDPFFNYFTNGVANMDLCTLRTEFHEMFFAVYAAVFNELMLFQGRTVPTSDAFTECFYNYFYETKSNFVVREFNRTSTRYNIFFKYLRALNVSDEALKTVANHTLSSDCKLDLFQLTHCSLCAGDPLLPCTNHCRNVLSGCLVDLKEFDYVYKEFHRSLMNTKRVLESYDPFGAFTILQTNILDFAFTINSDLSDIISALESRCSVSFPNGRKKRHSSPFVTASHRHVAKRQSPVAAMAALQSTVTCSANVSSTFDSLLNTMCNGSLVADSNCHCWNGTARGSYNYQVPDGDRLQQQTNPELFVRADTGLMYKDALAKLKNVSETMQSCVDSVVDCPVNLCRVQLPSASDYDLSTITRYRSFSSTGYPVASSIADHTIECVFTSSSPVSPTSVLLSSTVTKSETTTVAMATSTTVITTTEITTSMETADQQATTATPSSVSTTHPISTPSSAPSSAPMETKTATTVSTTSVRPVASTTVSIRPVTSTRIPSVTVAPTRAIPTVTIVTVPTATVGSVDNPEVPDGDKEKLNSGAVSTLYISISLLIALSILALFI